MGTFYPIGRVFEGFFNRLMQTEYDSTMWAGAKAVFRAQHPANCFRSKTRCFRSSDILDVLLTSRVGYSSVAVENGIKNTRRTLLQPGVQDCTFTVGCFALETLVQGDCMDV